MLRSMMQVFVKNSVEAVEVYRKAFNAELLCAYPYESGGYMHAELNAYGQVIAVSEIEETQVTGNTMMFCFHMGEGCEEQVLQAFEVLKDSAEKIDPPGPCGFSSCKFNLVDKYGVYWCVFV